jgi:hypothetical protein
VSLSPLERERLRSRIAVKLAELEPLFVPEILMTFVARLPDKPECYIVVTSDHDPAAVAALVTRPEAPK